MPAYRRAALLCVLAAATGSLVLAQQPPEEAGPPQDGRLHFELDPAASERSLARVAELLGQGRTDEAVALLDALGRDPRVRDTFYVASGVKPLERTLATFDRKVRARLIALPAPARTAYAALHEAELERLVDLGVGTDELASLGELAARFPATRAAVVGTLHLAELELEHGRGDAAAARFTQALTEDAAELTPAERDTAKRLLPVALELAGRTGESDRALSELAGQELERAKALVAIAKAERAADAVPAPTAGEVAWAHETFDYYDEGKEPPVPLSEPALDGTRVYYQDGTHALALSLETGAVEWQTALRAGDDAYRRPAGPCRLALGTTVVACSLPGSSLVVLDRATGSVLARLAPADVEKLAGLEDHDFSLAPSLAVVEDTLVLALTAHHADDELSVVGLDARTGALRFRTAILTETADPEAPAPELAAGPDAVYLATGRGAVAALEPATGGVIWLRRYMSASDGRPAEARAWAARVRRGLAPALPGTPAEPAPEKPKLRPTGFVGFLHGYVVLAPADARQVFAFDPRTGETVWKQGDEARPGKPPVPWTVLAPTADGVLVLDEAGTLLHVDRHEQHPVARMPGAKVVGSAAYASGVLALPLEAGLVRVETADGALAQLAGWEKTAGRPANVAIARGRIVALTAASTLALAEPGAVAVPAFATAHDAARALGDARWPVREAAQAKLLELGVAAKDELAWAAGTRDPERRLRARFIQDELARHERLEAWRPRVRPEWTEKDKDLLLKLTHRNPEVRLTTLRELVKFGDAVVPLLKDLLADADPRVAAAAGEALLERKDRSGVEVVRRALESEKVEDRVAAATALGRHGAPEDLLALVKTADDPEPRVRAVAIAGCLALGGEKSVPLAIKALDDPDDEVRDGLAQQILGMGLPLDVLAPIFKKLVHDPQRAIREMVVLKGLRDAKGLPISHPGVFAALGDALADTDAAVRRVATEVLFNVTREQFHLVPRGAIEHVLDQPNQDDNQRFHTIQIVETLLEEGQPFAAGPLARVALDARNESLRDQGGSGRSLREHALDDLLQSAQLAPLTSMDLAAIASLVVPTEPVKLRKGGYEALVNGKGEGKGRLLLRGLEDPDQDLREFVRGSLAEAADRDVLAELLRREAVAEKPDDQAQAAAVLDARGDALAPVAVRGLVDPDERVRANAWRRCRVLARADEDLGLFEPGAAESERAPAVERACRWWWRKSHEGRELSEVVGALAASTSAERWRAAKRLGDLAAPELRPLAGAAVLDAIAKAAASEPDDYVKRQELATLEAIKAARP